MKKKEKPDTNDEELSFVKIPIYAELEGDPDDQLMQLFHNQLAKKTIEEAEEANINADRTNEWISNLKKAAIVKKIQQISFAFFGFLIIVWGILLAPHENGLIYLSDGIIGIILAGFGIFLTSFTSLFFNDDDILQLLIVARYNQNQMFVQFSKIHAQLSFIQNELIALKKNSQIPKKEEIDETA